MTACLAQILRVKDGRIGVVPEGSCFGIVGESGSGKTTVLRAILGLQPVQAGTVRLFGAPQTLRKRDFSAQSRLIQMIFQDPARSLSLRRRIGQLLDEVGEVLGEPRDSPRARAGKLLDRLGLPASTFDKYAHQISGGQARRAAIAGCGKAGTASQEHHGAQVKRLLLRSRSAHRGPG